MIVGSRKGRTNKIIFEREKSNAGGIFGRKRQEVQPKVGRGDHRKGVGRFRLSLLGTRKRERDRYERVLDNVKLEKGKTGRNWE